MGSHQRFFEMIKKVPRITHLWDIERRRMDTKTFEAELGVMSSGEVHMAKFFASVWLHDNQKYGFDLVDAVAAIDPAHCQLIIEWTADPFYP